MHLFLFALCFLVKLFIIFFSEALFCFFSETFYLLFILFFFLILVKLHISFFQDCPSLSGKYICFSLLSWNILKFQYNLSWKIIKNVLKCLWLSWTWEIFSMVTMRGSASVLPLVVYDKGYQNLSMTFDLLFSLDL